MQQRIFSFALLWTIIAISILLLGAHAGVLLVAVIALLSQLELYQLFEKMGLKPMKGLGLACGAVISLGAYYVPSIDSGNDLFVLCFVVLTLSIIRLDLQAGRLRSFMPTLFGLLYVPYLLHFAGGAHPPLRGQELPTITFLPMFGNDALGIAAVGQL